MDTHGARTEGRRQFSSRVSGKDSALFLGQEDAEWVSPVSDAYTFGKNSGNLGAPFSNHPNANLSTVTETRLFI
jgi:hypothetical protein